MTNLTLAIDEGLLKSVRRLAAARDTTANALVRDYLTKLASEDERATAARARLLELADRSTGELGPRGWDRQRVYGR